MRTPKEVIKELVINMGADPFGVTIDTLKREIINAEKEVTKAGDKLIKARERLLMRQNYELERLETLRYIKELK